MGAFLQRRSVVEDLAATAAAVLLVVGGAMCVVSYIGFSIALDRQLVSRAEMLGERLAEAIQEHIWNMDEDSIGEYMRGCPQPSFLVGMRVTSEFGDVIYDSPAIPAKGLMGVTRDVHREGRLIGHIHIAVSREQVHVVQRAITLMSFLIIGVGAVVVWASLLLRQRIVIGRGFGRLISGIQTVSNGDYAQRVAQGTHREFDELSGQINRMAEQIGIRRDALHVEIAQRRKAERQLRQLTESLEDEVLERTRELRESNKRLESEVAERRKAEAEILIISGREQRRLGRDLHDGLGQQLVGISFLSKSLASRLETASPENADIAAQVSKLVSEAVMQSRDMAHGLYPVGMPGTGFKEALDDLAQRVESLFGVRCEVHCEEDISLGADIATHLYRIAQEGVSNARRHGAAKHIIISLVQEGGVLRFTVEDDGTGIPDSSEPGDGVGLNIMKYRAEAVGGTFSISRRDGGGTVLCVIIPEGAVKIDSR